METLYIEINISKFDVETDDIRNDGLLFQYVTETVGLDGMQLNRLMRITTCQ